ncbi:unnamed protein product [Closterium sp. NIES-64]|nr:unnamed protein product [Closterium sp. NIES-64]
MTLLLGPPGSGKSTLLRILAGKAERELGVQGEVTYNGRRGSHFVLPRSVAFVPQTDSHIGELTVRETLEFSARLQGPSHRAELFRQLEEKEENAGVQPDDTMQAVMKVSDDVMQAVMKAMADERQCSNVVVQFVLKVCVYVWGRGEGDGKQCGRGCMKMLGLDVCADTMVGDSMRRGISGGQKKRITTAEALLGAKQVLLLDEISTGLDSATTYQITRCLRNLTHLTNTTTLISLLQPAPETFELFDDVMLMSEGRIVYHGPREEVLGFFREMGFVPPARKGVADFLQEVTSLKDQKQYWRPAQPHRYHYVSVRAFEEAFRASRSGKQIEAELSIPFKQDHCTAKGGSEGKVVDDSGAGEGKDVENGGEEGKGGREDGSLSLALVKRRFALPPLALLSVVADHEWLLMKRNLFLYIVQTMQILPLAIVTMTVFWHSQFSVTPVDSNYYLGAIFFGISTMLFSGIIELTTNSPPAHLLPPKGQPVVPCLGLVCAHGAALSARLPLRLLESGPPSPTMASDSLQSSPGESLAAYCYLRWGLDRHRSLAHAALSAHLPLRLLESGLPSPTKDSYLLLNFPVSLLLLSAEIWTTIKYYGIGLAPVSSRFIAQLLLFFITHMSASALYRAMGAAFRSTTLINTLGNFILVTLFLLSGFLITKGLRHGQQRTLSPPSLHPRPHSTPPLTPISPALSALIPPSSPPPTSTPALHPPITEHSNGPSALCPPITEHNDGHSGAHSAQPLDTGLLVGVGQCCCWEAALVSISPSSPTHPLFSPPTPILSPSLAQGAASDLPASAGPWPRAQPVISQHQLDARETALAGTNLDFASRYSSLRSRTLARTGSTATARFLASNRFRSSKSLTRPAPSARSMKSFSSGSQAGGGGGGVELERVGTMSHRRGLGLKGSSFMGGGESFQRSASRMGSFMGSSKMGDAEERGSVFRSVTKSWRTFSIAGAGAAAGGGGCVGAGAAVAAVGDVDVGTGGDIAVSSRGVSGEKKRQRKAVSFLSDVSDGAEDTAGSSAGGGAEKQRQRKAVSFFSDGDASEGAGETACSSTGQGERLSEQQQQQQKENVLTRNDSLERDGDNADVDLADLEQLKDMKHEDDADDEFNEYDATGGLAGGGDICQHGMVLPFDPLTLSFHNVNYYVDTPAELKDKATPPGERLQLLRNVSGVFRPGVLTALMGVYGAGKTTLMDVLAGRKTGGYVEGDIRVSGYPKLQEPFLRVSGYCEQVDIHTPQVTVHESLLYSAWMRLPEEIDRDVILEFVEEVMELVELEPVKGALVGTAGQDGLSVEQRKRLTIAVELVGNPDIIFMDEPTSGLDARAAAIVMRAVRNTVNTGRTVVCTIHQPSIDIFEAFDEAISGVPPIQPGANPAAWMLEVTAPAAAERLGVDFAQLFRQSDQFRVIESLIQESSIPPEGEPDLFFPTQHPTTPLSQFATHLWKRHLMYWRMPDYNGARFFFSFIMALLIGGVFFGFGHARDTPQQIVNVMGALYTAALFLRWSNLASIQPMLAVERIIYYREQGAGMYGAIPYALAQGAIELPYLVVQALVYSLITYSMIRFEWTLGKFLLYLLFQFLTLLYFTCFGMMTSAITPAEGLGTLLSAFIYSFWNLLCGFLLPQPVSAVLVAICFRVLDDCSQ